MKIYRLLKFILLVLLIILSFSGLTLGLISGPQFLAEIADKILEILYPLHKIIVYLIVGLVIVVEGIKIMIRMVIELGKELENLWKNLTRKTTN